MSSSPIESLSLPPTGFYPSFNALFNAAQAYAASAGYAFTTERSTKNRQGRVKKTLSYKKGGHDFKPKVKDINRIRQRSTFKADYPFLVYAKERLTGQWELCHSQTTTTKEYNHPLSNPQAFAEHRRRELNARGVSTIIITHYINGIPASRTASVLRSQLEGSILIYRDIYNVISKYNREARGAASPAKALIRDLEVEEAAKKINGVSTT
ncbi:hypothetical protein BKA61DRAFT_569284 [Leptodontidium sp. MPI-SDFR-AT-0119]|nr:hypothetical protein BKA61DRAFT_569284 [Leptodontidium sp. MPI-SDFR-AT-0119]